MGMKFNCEAILCIHYGA